MNIKITNIYDNKYKGKLYELNISIFNFIILLINNKSFIKFLKYLIINESFINNKLYTVRILFNKFTKHNIFITNIKFIIFLDYNIHKITYYTSWKQFNNQSMINKPHAFRSHNNNNTILIVPAFSKKKYSNISKFAYYSTFDEFFEYFKFLALIILYNLNLINNNPNNSYKDIKRYPYFWLSFHGGSVPWLHGRLDSTPIYFPIKFIKYLQ